MALWHDSIRAVGKEIGYICIVYRGHNPTTFKRRGGAGEQTFELLMPLIVFVHVDSITFTSTGRGRKPQSFSYISGSAGWPECHPSWLGERFSRPQLPEGGVQLPRGFTRTPSGRRQSRHKRRGFSREDLVYWAQCWWPCMWLGGEASDAWTNNRLTHGWQDGGRG